MNTILEAATSDNIRHAAWRYLDAGCSIIPLNGKKPTGKWDFYQTRRVAHNKLRQWIKSGEMKNIGLVCGEISGGLVVIDVDSMAACFEFEAAFPNLCDTLTVRSGSGRGKHYYFYAADILPANLYMGGIEMRGNGAYVVASPSIHPVSGLAYCVLRDEKVRKTNLLNDVRRWMKERAEPAPAPRRPTSPTPPTSKSAYGQAALQGECAAVRHAPEGSANATLYRAALKMGSLIASGVLTRMEVEIALETAAEHLSSRDGLTATQRTIQSGLKVGMGSPRPVKS